MSWSGVAEAGCDQATEQVSPTSTVVRGICDSLESARVACIAGAASVGYSEGFCHLGGGGSGGATNYALYSAGNLCTSGNTPGSCGSGEFVLFAYYALNYYVSLDPPRRAQCTTCNNVNGSVNPGNGSTQLQEEDSSNGDHGIGFNRHYTSVESSSGELGHGWRGSYSRRITPRLSSIAYEPYVPGSLNNSTGYSSPSLACASGFATIRSRVPSYQNAIAAYGDGECSVMVGGTVIGSVQIYAYQAQPFSARVAVVNALATATLVAYEAQRDNGQTIRFNAQNGVISQPPAVKLRLETISGGFKLTDTNDAVEIYDSNGVLQTITERSGVQQTFTYDANQRLSSVTDTFGNSLTLSYDASNRLASTTSGGQTTGYSYDSQSRLATVTKPDQTANTYLYEDTRFPLALTGKLDETATRVASWTYNTQGRVSATQLAGVSTASTLTYNTDNTVTTTDALGAVRTFTYEQRGDLKLPSGISGSQCPTCQEPKVTTYDLAGFPSSRTDYNDNVTLYAYDPIRGVETSRTEASGTPQARTITTQWHPTYRLPTQVNEPGRRTTFIYDSNGNLLSRTVLDTATSDARITTFTYNNFGQVLTVDGPRTDVSDVTTYTYYNCSTGSECGQVQTVTDALGYTTTYNTYNAVGQPLSITDPNGVVTTLTYDLRQRLTSRETAGESTTFEYFPTGLLKKITLSDGSTLQYLYDQAHRLTQITDTDGSYIVYTLDANGNRTAENVFDPQGTQARTHTRTFNTLSRLASDINAAGAVATTTYEYDPNGNQTAVNAPLQRTTLAAFDALDRLQQTTDEMNGVTQYGYNVLDQLTTVTDPRNLQTTYSYNALDDLTQQSSPDSGVTQFTYDPAGNVATLTDARGKVGTYSYDATNRLTQVQYSDETQTFNYDQGTNGIGRLTSLSDGSSSTSYTYTSLGRVASKTQVTGSVSKTVVYGYNVAGQLASVTTPSGQTIAYGYENNRITSITVNGTNVLGQVLYEPLGPTRGWTWGNGTLTVREFDTDGRLQSIDSAGLTTYTFNPDDTILSKSSEDSTVRPAGGTTLLSIASNSNRLGSTSGVLNRTYTYDPAGNVTGNGTSSFVYNDAGRMVSSTTAGATTTYALNALGQRVKKSNVAGTTYFVYDENGRLHGEYDGSGALIQELVWLEDIPVATIRTTSGGTGVGVFYIHTDHLNSPTKITRPADNASIWRWDHDPFGVGTPSEDPDGNGMPLVFNLRFPGQYFDSETGLNYNYFRDYDPATGRYVQSDPIGLRGGINTYGYAAGNPLRFIDPLGLTERDINDALRIARESQADLKFPDDVAVRDLSKVEIGGKPLGPRVVGLTLPGVGTIIDDRYLKKLSDKQACELLDTIIHEGVHYTLPPGDERQVDDAIPGHPNGYPYDEAKRRTTPALCKRLNRERKEKTCEN